MISLSGCGTGQPIDLRCVDGFHPGRDDVPPIAGGKKKAFPKAEQRSAKSAGKPSRYKAKSAVTSKTSAAIKKAPEDVTISKVALDEAKAAEKADALADS